MYGQIKYYVVSKSRGGGILERKHIIAAYSLSQPIKFQDLLSETEQ